MTMNALAMRGGICIQSPPPLGRQHSMIIGDGVLQFLTDARLTSLGQDFVHAHEFGHHLQCKIDLVHNVPEGYKNDI